MNKKIMFFSENKIVGLKENISNLLNLGGSAFNLLCHVVRNIVIESLTKHKNVWEMRQ